MHKNVTGTFLDEKNAHGVGHYTTAAASGHKGRRDRGCRVPNNSSGYHEASVKPKLTPPKPVVVVPIPSPLTTTTTTTTTVASSAISSAVRPGWGAAPPPTNAFLGISRRGARTDNGVQGLHPLLAGDSVETTAQLSVKASCAADASHSVDVGDDTSAARQQPNGEVKPEVMYLTEHKQVPMLGKTTVVGTTDKDALPLRATSLTAALLGNLPPGPTVTMRSSKHDADAGVSRPPVNPWSTAASPTDDGVMLLKEQGCYSVGVSASAGDCRLSPSSAFPQLDEAVSLKEDARGLPWSRCKEAGKRKTGNGAKLAKVHPSTLVKGVEDVLPSKAVARVRDHHRQGGGDRLEDAFLRHSAAPAAGQRTLHNDFHVSPSHSVSYEQSGRSTPSLLSQFIAFDPRRIETLKRLPPPRPAASMDPPSDSAAPHSRIFGQRDMKRDMAEAHRRDCAKVDQEERIASHDAEEVTEVNGQQQQEEPLESQLKADGPMKSVVRKPAGTAVLRQTLEERLQEEEQRVRDQVSGSRRKLQELDARLAEEQRKRERRKCEEEEQRLSQLPESLSSNSCAHHRKTPPLRPGNTHLQHVQGQASENNNASQRFTPQPETVEASNVMHTVSWTKPLECAQRRHPPSPQDTYDIKGRRYRSFLRPSPTPFLWREKANSLDRGTINEDWRETGHRHYGTQSPPPSHVENNSSEAYRAPTSCLTAAQCCCCDRPTGACFVNTSFGSDDSCKEHAQGLATQRHRANNVVVSSQSENEHFYSRPSAMIHPHQNELENGQQLWPVHERVPNPAPCSTFSRRFPACERLAHISCCPQDNTFCSLSTSLVSPAAPYPPPPPHLTPVGFSNDLLNGLATETPVRRTSASAPLLARPRRAPGTYHQQFGSKLQQEQDESSSAHLFADIWLNDCMKDHRPSMYPAPQSSSNVSAPTGSGIPPPPPPPPTVVSTTAAPCRHVCSATPCFSPNDANSVLRPYAPPPAMHHPTSLYHTVEPHRRLPSSSSSSYAPQYGAHAAIAPSSTFIAMRTCEHRHHCGEFAATVNSNFTNNGKLHHPPPGSSKSSSLPSSPSSSQQQQNHQQQQQQLHQQLQYRPPHGEGRTSYLRLHHERDANSGAPSGTNELKARHCPAPPSYPHFFDHYGTAVPPIVGYAQKLDAHSDCLSEEYHSANVPNFTATERLNGSFFSPLVHERTRSAVEREPQPMSSGNGNPQYVWVLSNNATQGSAPSCCVTNSSVPPHHDLPPPVREAHSATVLLNKHGPPPAGVSSSQYYEHPLPPAPPLPVYYSQAVDPSTRYHTSSLSPSTTTGCRRAYATQQSETGGAYASPPTGNLGASSSDNVTVARDRRRPPQDRHSCQDYAGCCQKSTKASSHYHHIASQQPSAYHQKTRRPTATPGFETPLSSLNARAPATSGHPGSSNYYFQTTQSATGSRDDVSERKS